MNQLSIEFGAQLNKPENISKLLVDLYSSGARDVQIETTNESLLQSCHETLSQFPDKLTLRDRNINLNADAYILTADDPLEQSRNLLTFIDHKNARIIANITDYYYQHRPLYVVTIPKSGSHLLYQLLERLGFYRGVTSPVPPKNAHYYFIRGSNSHTNAKDFFIRDVADNPFGNRHHPFTRNPLVFLYRNPFDILVSEAHYYHLDGKTSYAAYLSSLSIEQRLFRLIDDPWLLGSIRDRIGAFIPWLDFPNVLPISFEELVGDLGNGSIEKQEKAVWSLMLHLHVPGSPKHVTKNLFGKQTDTFRSGIIGEHTNIFTNNVWDKLEKTPKDYIKTLGYSTDGTDYFSNRVNEFQKRLLQYSKIDTDLHPVELIIDFHGYNIIQYKKNVIGIPISAGCIDLTTDDYLNKKEVLVDSSLFSVKYKILNYLTNAS